MAGAPGFGLEGKRILVLGGGQGMGESTSRLLAAAGARVAVGRPRGRARRADREEVGGVPVVVDVTDDDALVAAIAATEAELGPLDGLVTIIGMAAWARLVDMTTGDLGPRPPPQRPLLLPRRARGGAVDDRARRARFDRVRGVDRRHPLGRRSRVVRRGQGRPREPGEDDDRGVVGPRHPHQRDRARRDDHAAHPRAVGRRGSRDDVDGADAPARHHRRHRQGGAVLPVRPLHLRHRPDVGRRRRLHRGGPDRLHRQPPAGRRVGSRGDIG